MHAEQQNTASVRPLEAFLAALGALACVVITVWLWRSVSAYQPMWPLPGLYFIEVAGLSVLGVQAFVRGGSVGKLIMWAAVGILAAFSILGAFSVGSSYLPTTLIFAIVSVTYDIRNRGPIAAHLGLCLIAGLAQAALMLTLIRLLYPSAMF